MHFSQKTPNDRVYGDHRLLIGEIVAVHWLKEIFMDDGSLDLEHRSARLLYLGNEHYVSTESGTIRTTRTPVLHRPPRREIAYIGGYAHD